jgi:WD40 repeat protein
MGWVAWFPDGARIASAGSNGNISVWNARTAATPLRYRASSSIVHSWALSPDGSRVASGCEDNTVQVWDTATGQHLLTYTDHSDWVNAAAWSPDGRFLASADRRDERVRVWDAATGGNVCVYRAFIGDVGSVAHSIAWSPDGTRIVSRSDGGVLICEALTGKTLLRDDRRCHRGPVAWSPDGRRIALVEFWPFVVRVWDAATGETTCSYDGHPGNIRALAWSPDGRSIASGSFDRTTQVWEPG